MWNTYPLSCFTVQFFLTWWNRILNVPLYPVLLSLNFTSMKTSLQSLWTFPNSKAVLWSMEIKLGPHGELLFLTMKLMLLIYKQSYVHFIPPLTLLPVKYGNPPGMHLLWIKLMRCKSQVSDIDYFLRPF